MKEIRILFFMLICFFYKAQISINDFDNTSKPTVDFDITNKIPFSVISNPKIGQLTIYYIPRNNILKKYYHSFLNTYHIKLQHDELNDIDYIKDYNRKQINKILQNKIRDKQSYTTIGMFIDKKYINYENNEEYQLYFPYKIKYYIKQKESWSLIKENLIKNADEEIKLSKIKNLESLFYNFPNKSEDFSKWYGIYKLTVNEKSKNWQDIQDVTLTIKKDSIIFHAEGYQIDQNYLLSYQQEENTIKLFYDKTIDNFESAVLEKTKDFGKLTFSKGKYTWSCPYIDRSFTNDNIYIYLLKKIKL